MPVDEAVVGQPVELVVVTTDRNVVTIDLASGSVVAQVVTSQPFGRPDVLVGNDWALIPSQNALLASTLLRRSEPPAAIEVGVADDIVGREGDALWVMEDSGAGEVSPLGGGIELRLVTIDGAETLAQVQVPSPPAGPDPAGGVLVRAAGGWFRVDVSMRERITSGDLLALGPDRALARECSDQLDCSLVAVHRDTGRRMPLTLTSGTDDTRSWVLDRLGGRAASISPDGAAALVEVIDASEPSGPLTVLGLVDLSTGHVNRIGATVAATQHAFSPDGRFVFFIRSGAALAAYDRADGRLVDVVVGGLLPEALGVRPTTADR